MGPPWWLLSSHVVDAPSGHFVAEAHAALLVVDRHVIDAAPVRNTSGAKTLLVVWRMMTLMPMVTRSGQVVDVSPLGGAKTRLCLHLQHALHGFPCLGQQG